MANRWTGAHDAVLELSPGGVGRLIAAIHRKGHRTSTSADGPHLVHSAAFDLPFLGTSPAAGPNLRGHLRLQVSTPSVDVPAGAPARVRVSVQTYAWFQPLAGSEPAPEFLHGTLALTVGLRIVRCRGVMLAEIGLASDDVEVDFTPAPGSGATSADVALVRAAVPAILRGAFGPAQFPLGSLSTGSLTVRDLAFKGLRSAAQSAFALLLTLRAGGPVANPDLVTEIFLAPQDDAALALGRELLTAVIFDFAQGPLGDVAVQGSRFIGVFGVGFTLSFQASVDPASLSIELQPGRIRVRVSGSGSLSPGGSFRFQLTRSFGLAVLAGRLRLTLVGGSDVDITQANPLLELVLGLFASRIENGVDDALGNVVGAVSDELDRVVGETVEGLLARVSLQDAKLALSQASVDPDGVLIGGRFDIGSAPAMVVGFTQRVRDGLTELDALESFIPGGTITRYVWRRVGVNKTATDQIDDPHRFVARAPLGPAHPVHVAVGWPPVSWCVAVHGTQVSSAGVQPVVGTRCGMTVLTVGLDLGATERLVVSVADADGGLLADVDPWGGYRPHAFAADAERRGLLLVHRPAEPAAQSVDALRATLASLDRAGPAVLATLVVAAGELAAHARATPELTLTHDPEGTWRKRFRLELGGTVLVGPGGKELWRSGGPLRAAELERALADLRAKGWGEKARLPRLRVLGHELAIGTLAPDVLFPCDGGMRVGSRKFRGRELALVFWTSWSEPALEELRRLAAGEPRGCDDDDRAPIVLCVNDGEPPERAAAALKERGLDVVLVPDEKRVLARQYHVSCWPTVVRIDPAGRIADVRLGLEHTPQREQSKPL